MNNPAIRPLLMAGATALSLVAAILPAHAQGGVRINALSGSSAFTPIRPPAIPLVTRAPYDNVWLETPTGQAPHSWPAHWNGAVKAITGIAMIDNTPICCRARRASPVSAAGRKHP